MSENRNPLRFNVGFMFNQPLGASREVSFETPLLDLPPDQVLNDVKGSARLGRTQQGILVQGEFDSTVQAECVRCLTEFMQPLHASFTELYAFRRNAVTESGLLIPDDANIDLAPLVREYSLLEIPIKPLCREDCKGLCPVCGEDLNVRTCEHQREE
jgi:uncharacterized protein